MSHVYPEIVRIDEISKHPDADRLDIVTVHGATVVTGRGNFSPGDLAVYFPPDLLLPDDVVQSLGVEKFLKHAHYPGDHGKSPCRVSACRLRGVPSYGFVVPLHEAYGVGADDLVDFMGSVGEDVSEEFGTVKYEPPKKELPPDVAPELANFHKYTDIERYQRHPNWFAEGTPVRITEKIHGRNCRVGCIKIDGEFQFVAGSHNHALKRPPEGGYSPYWSPLDDHNLLLMINHLCDGQHDVVVFGEIYGAGMQDMDYGRPPGEPGFRVFDISVNGRYLDYGPLFDNCAVFEVDFVPMLYAGPFSHEKVLELTSGSTRVGQPKCKFKGREGIVITPVAESTTSTGRRLILKSVSVDYLSRKDAEDCGDFCELGEEQA